MTRVARLVVELGAQRGGQVAGVAQWVRWRATWRRRVPRMAVGLIDEVFDALDEQTVRVPGTGTLDIVVLSLAR